MKKIINIGLLMTSMLFTTACENDIDNYSSPNGGIKGTIYDATTNEPIPLPVQGGDGVMINMYEQNTNATVFIDFRAKQDGTFENKKMFNCEYKIVVNGPFVDKCEGIVTVKGQTEYSIKATPYSRIDVNATVSTDNKVSIDYEVVPTDALYTVDEVFVMWNFVPGVDTHSSNYATRSTLNVSSGNHIFDLPTINEFKNNHYKIQANNNKIYVRVAAKIKGIINYSKVMELTVK